MIHVLQLKKIMDKKSTQRLGDESVYESCLPISRKFFDSRRIVPQSPLGWKEKHRISSNNSQGHFFLRTKRGRLFEGGDYMTEAIISNIAHWKSFPEYFVLLSPLFIKKLHQLN